MALQLALSLQINRKFRFKPFSTEGNNPYKWDESFHVNSSTRASKSPDEAYEFVPDGLTFGDYPGPINGVGTRIILWGASI